MDILARIVLNYCNKFIILALRSGVDSKKDKVAENVFIHAIKLLIRLAKTSWKLLNSDHIIDVFNSYKLGIDYNKSYLTIDRKEYGKSL